MAVYTFKHSFVGRAKQAPGTAAAHLRYITRKNATHIVYSERMPRQYHAAQRFVQEREESIRKNGRVLDKFIIAVPREMKQDEAMSVLKRFGFAASEGRTPFLFSLHGFGTNNPHAHFVLIDADVETGKRVFGTTDKGSTDRLRALWEKVCNGELERGGYDARIDRRPQAEIEAEREAERQAEPELSDKSGQLPRDAPTDQLEPAPEDAQESEHVPPPQEPPVPVAEKIHGAVQLNRRLNELAGAKSKLAWLEAQAERADREQQHHLQQVEQQANDAKAVFDTYQQEKAEFETTFLKGNGKLVGFKLFGWRTPARVIAEETQARVQHQERVHKALDRDLTHSMAHQNELSFRAAQAELPVQEQRDRMRELYGTKDEMAQAEMTITDNRDRRMEGLTADEVMDELTAGKISHEEAREACLLLGAIAQVRAIEEQMEYWPEMEIE